MSKKLILTTKSGDGLLVACLAGLSLRLGRANNGPRAGVEPEVAEASKASEPVAVSTRRLAAQAIA